MGRQPGRDGADDGYADRVILDARGPASPDEVWRRYLTPATWPHWAPHIAATASDTDVLGVGGTGRVYGPGGVSVRFRVDRVDPRLRSWAWTVQVGPVSVRLSHDVLPAPGGGSRATMRAEGVPGLALQPYRPFALAALRGLVTGAVATAAEHVQTHPFVFAPSHVVPGRLVGVTPRTSTIELGPSWLYVAYGPWRLVTPRTNVASTHLTGDYSWLKTAGPAHLSFADHGVSFTPNADAGVCVRFHEPVAVLDPTGVLVHPAATLGVRDPDAFARTLVDEKRGAGG
nr:SRPBCC family protein [Propioniciclava soli]